MPKKNEKKPAKTCPVSKEDFFKKAKPIQVLFQDSEGNLIGSATATLKEFSTGSYGWYFSGKITPTVEGTALETQTGLNMTAVGSKPVTE